MHQLVFVDQNKTVTDSLTIANVFGKEHRRVMQDIRELECSDEFRLHHFVQSSYLNNQGRPTPKYIITEQGFTLLVMRYTGKEAMRFKEQYIAEFERMREKLNSGLDISGLSPQLQLLIQMEQSVKQIEQRQQRTESQLTTIKETFLQRDDDWRNKINGMLNGAAKRSGITHRDIRAMSYQILEERGRCDLQRRLTNLKERLADSGATKTKINDANRLDVIESDPRLKEIYDTVVKELAIGTLA